MAKKVKVPKTHSPGGGRPLEYLAYLNRQEMDYLRALNNGHVSRGPKGLPSFAEESLAGPGGNKGSGAGGGSRGGSTSSGAGGQGKTTSGTQSTSATQQKGFDRSQTMMTDANGVSYDYNGNVVKSATNPAKSNSAASPNFPSSVNLDRQVQNQTQIKDAIQAVKNTPAVKNSSVTGGISSINVGPMGTPVSVGSAQRVAPSTQSTSQMKGPKLTSTQPTNPTPKTNPMEKTYAAMRSSLVTGDPRIQELAEKMPGVKFAVERKLMSDVQPQVQDPQKAAKGLVTYGSFDPASGTMYVNEKFYGNPLVGNDPFRGYGPAGHVGDIYAHEVAGHGTSEALSSTPYLENYNTLANLNRETKDLAGFGNPNLVGPGTWYSQNLGDEVLARLSEKKAAELQGNLKNVLTVEESLGEIAPSIYGGPQFGNLAIGRSAKPTSSGGIYDMDAMDYLNNVYAAREQEAQRLLDKNIPTVYEINRGIAQLPTRWDRLKSIFTGKPPVHGGWLPESYEEYMNRTPDYIK